MDIEDLFGIIMTGVAVLIIGAIIDGFFGAIIWAFRYVAGL